MTLTRRLCTLSISLLLFAAMPAGAGEITSVTWFSGVASVALTGTAPPVSANNDNQVGSSPNIITVLQKDYTAIGTVDLEFTVIDSGGTTEYLIVEGVSNSSTIDWSGYHLELGYGVGGSFVKSTVGDGLDFDSPDYDSPVDFNPSPGFFPTVNVTEDDIIASGGIHPYLAFAGNYGFHIDVPDGITTFTLRQSPVPVPEPGTAALSLLGLAGLAVRRRRGRD